MRGLLKQAAIVGGLEAISRLRMDRLFPRAGGRGLIFTLHHVRPIEPKVFNPNAHLEITPYYLEAVMQAVRGAGLVPTRLEDLPARLADTSDHNRYVCFTLDDGYRNNASHAAPIFRRHGMPYTIFITPGFVDRSVTLWWETAAELIGKVERLEMDFGRGRERLPTRTAKEKHEAFCRLCEAFRLVPEEELVTRLDRLAAESGIDPRGMVERELMNAEDLRALANDPLVSFGGHTMTHRKLARLPEDEMRREIRQSVETVAALTEKPVTTFAYPYGTGCAAGEREFQAAREAGIRVAVTTRPGMLGDQTLERLMSVPRVSLNGLYQKKHYIPALISGLPFKLKKMA